MPGVGAKTAARLLLELRSRLEVPGDDVTVTGTVTGGNGVPSSRAEVQAALAALGYQPDEVHEALRELPDDGDVQQLLKSALRSLGARR